MRGRQKEERGGRGEFNTTPTVTSLSTKISIKGKGKPHSQQEHNSFFKFMGTLLLKIIFLESERLIREGTCRALF